MYYYDILIWLILLSTLEQRPRKLETGVRTTEVTAQWALTGNHTLQTNLIGPRTPQFELETNQPEPQSQTIKP